MVEATAVTAEGRITHGDVGLWHDGQIAPLKRIAAFIKENGSVPAIQLAHAGRKASMQRPWFGNAALDDGDRARGDLSWRVVAPSAIPMDQGWLMPHELSDADLKSLRDNWRLATLRAVEAGYEFLELHCAHGYLLHEFLSPLSNRRTDGYGGDHAARMRYPLEVLETVRAAWPVDLPLSVRISSVDGIDGGIDLADSVAFAKEVKARGADIIDCSSGGLMGSATAARIPRGYSFQVPFAQEIRQKAEIATMAVGLILHPQQAEDILMDGSADLIAIGREALFDPNWPLHAQMVLESRDVAAFAAWPRQYGWWLERREPGLRKLEGPALPFRRVR
jgi:2,4-dienoyl-CoA reductase-like NADH-dependent reductase (Old Yellow Enzyme family)